MFNGVDRFLVATLEVVVALFLLIFVVGVIMVAVMYVLDVRKTILCAEK